MNIASSISGNPELETSPGVRIAFRTNYVLHARNKNYVQLQYV